MRRAGLIAVIAALTLAGCGDDESAETTSSPTATSGTGEDVVFPSNCTSGLSPEPASVVVSCADAGISVSELEWRSWGAKTAQGVGTAHVNDCDPDCVAGEIKTYDDAQVKLSAIESCGSTRQYTILVLSYAGESPQGSPKHSRYRFPCP